jgi:hypothetical protein
MSAIDQYKHILLGFIECPSSFDFVFNNTTRKIPIYELLEDIPTAESNFNGKAGDIILGGGSGEAPAFRVSIPETLSFLTQDDWDNFETHTDLFEAFWTPTQAFKFGNGYFKIGWNPDSPIELWLAENVCKLLTDNFDKYSTYKIEELEQSALSLSKTH